MIKSKKIIVPCALLAAVIFIQMCLSIYTYMFFDIEKYMISKRFGDDIAKHAAAKNAGTIKYCDNYVMLHGGMPQSSLHTIGYYRVDDGRLYSVGGQLCWGFSKWRIIDFRKYLFSEYETPLTCEVPPKDLICSENCSSFECAIRYNETNSIKSLIELGQDPNEITQYMGKISVLMYAIEKRNYEITEILIKNGANTNLKNKAGKTALHELAEGVRRDAIFFKTFSLLIENGANINAQANNGSTPLYVLMNWTRGKPDEIRALKMFLDNGANPNIKIIRGDNVLSRYLSMGSPKRDVVQIFLDYNADPFMKNNKGTTPYDIAKERLLEGIVQLFEQI